MGYRHWRRRLAAAAFVGEIQGSGQPCCSDLPTEFRDGPRFLDDILVIVLPILGQRI